MTEDEMAGWHHRFNGHEFDQTPGDSERQGSFSLVQSLSRVQLFATPWTAAPGASLNLSQHQGLFKWVSSWHHVQSIGFSASTSVLPMNI